jgi:hypothetical protein
MEHNALATPRLGFELLEMGRFVIALAEPFEALFSFGLTRTAFRKRGLVK